MLNKNFLIGHLIGFLVVGLYFSLYQIPEGHKAIKFGSIKLLKDQRKNIPIIQKPGLHWRVPVLDEVIRYDTRVQQTIIPAIPINITKDNIIWIDYVITWRIDQPMQYVTAMRASPINLQTWLIQWVKQDLNMKAIANSSSTDHVLMRIQSKLQQAAEQKGLKILYCNIIQKKPASNFRQSILNHMQTEQSQKATEYLKRGQMQANAIQNQAQTDCDKLLANAYAKVADIKSQGKALATQRYIKAYRKNPKFAFFYQRLISYERSFSTNQPCVILMQADAPLLL